MAILAVCTISSNDQMAKSHTKKEILEKKYYFKRNSHQSPNLAELSRGIIVLPNFLFFLFLYLSIKKSYLSSSFPFPFYKTSLIYFSFHWLALSDSVLHMVQHPCQRIKFFTKKCCFSFIYSDKLKASQFCNLTGP